MSDRTIDLPSLLELWPEAKPSSGFADRVLAACDPARAQARPIVRPPRRTTWLAAGALAAAMVLVPLFLYRSARPSTAAPLADASYDLGIERD
jgi:hypothetical protein